MSSTFRHMHHVLNKCSRASRHAFFSFTRQNCKHFSTVPIISSDRPPATSCGFSTLAFTEQEESNSPFKGKSVLCLLCEFSSCMRLGRLRPLMFVPLFWQTAYNVETFSCQSPLILVILFFFPQSFLLYCFNSAFYSWTVLLKFYFIMHNILFI